MKREGVARRRYGAATIHNRYEVVRGIWKGVMVVLGCKRLHPAAVEEETDFARALEFAMEDGLVDLG